MPGTALHYNQLRFKEKDASQKSSEHEVLSAEWADESGQKIEGFYKKVNKSKYPELLAKYCVAASVFARLFLGEIAVEDRLVLGEQGNIVGTFSRKHPDYKPMECGYSNQNFPDPNDPNDAELVSPKRVETLLEHKVLRVLYVALLLGDADRHPNNMSIKGEGVLLDYDEFFPEHAMIIKGRTGWLESWRSNKPQKLISQVFDNFPILLNDFARTHWPTNDMPLNKNPFKQFTSYLLFQQLAANPSAIVDGQKITAQEQGLDYKVMMLLTYDPEVLLARLFDALGDLPLNYLTLDEQKIAALQETDPTLFNEHTNQGRFIDHMLQLCQRKYDEFYLSVVRHKGCEKNIKEVPVASFVDSLRHRASAYKKAIQWAQQQNEKLALPPTQQFDLSKMSHRYQALWRDAFNMQVGDLLGNFKKLAQDMAQMLCIQSQQSESPVALRDETITESWQLIEYKMPNVFLAEVAVDTGTATDEEAGQRKALKLLLEFTNQFGEDSKKYYKCPRDLLKPPVNKQYCDDLLGLLSSYQDKILDALNSRQEWGHRFKLEVIRLQSLYKNIGIGSHLLSLEDQELLPRVNLGDVSRPIRSHKDMEVVNAFITALFAWASQVDKFALIDIISEVLKKDYNPPLAIVPLLGIFGGGEAKLSNPFYNRTRGEEIGRYLDQAKSDRTIDGANLLAYIFSTGQHKSTSLNTCLVRNMMSLVLDKMMQSEGLVDVNLMSLQNALDDDKSNPVRMTDYVLNPSKEGVAYELYTEKLMEYVRTSPQFATTYSQISQKNFNEAMYQWVDSLPREQFEALIQQANVELTRSWTGFAMTLFGSGSQDGQYRQITTDLKTQKLTHSCILGRLFKGEAIKDESSYSYKLFELIYDKINAVYSTSKQDALKNQLNAVARVNKQVAMRYPSFDSFRVVAEQVSRQPGSSSGALLAKDTPGVGSSSETLSLGDDWDTDMAGALA